MKATKYSEGRESTFTHFGKEYYVDDLIALTNNKSVGSLEISRLDWVFEYSTPNEERVDSADLSVPIIVTKDIVDGKTRYIVLDGLHRLAKAIKLGKKTVHCYVIPKDEVSNLSKVIH